LAFAAGKLFLGAASAVTASKRARNQEVMNLILGCLKNNPSWRWLKPCAGFF
jgi:hypothetical protein